MHSKQICSSLFFFLFFPFIYISWRLITLQYCSGFCHTLIWICHGFTCVPHPEPPPPPFSPSCTTLVAYVFQNVNDNSFDLVIFCLQDFKCKNASAVSIICLYYFFFFFEKELARLNGEDTNVVHYSSFFGYFYPDRVKNVIICSPHFSVSN